MKIVFHGTSLENAENIIKSGWCIPTKNWMVSTPNPFFFNFPTMKEGFTRALCQTNCAIVKTNKSFKRAVIAFNIDEKYLIPDSTIINPIVPHYSVEYIGPNLNKEQIVGCWCDKYSLSPIKNFYITQISNFTLSGFNLPEELTPFKNMFIRDTELQSKVSCVVPIECFFINGGLDFNPTDFLYHV